MTSIGPVRVPQNSPSGGGATIPLSRSRHWRRCTAECGVRGSSRTAGGGAQGKRKRCRCPESLGSIAEEEDTENTSMNGGDKVILQSSGVLPPTQGPFASEHSIGGGFPAVGQGANKQLEQRRPPARSCLLNCGVICDTRSRKWECPSERWCPFGKPA